MPQESKQLKPPLKELLIKSLIYRVWTFAFDTTIALIMVYLANINNIFIYIAILNTAKTATYLGYDLGWFILTNRPGILKRIGRKLLSG